MNIPGQEELQIYGDHFLGTECPGFPSISGAVLGNILDIPGTCYVSWMDIVDIGIGSDSVSLGGIPN